MKGDFSTHTFQCHILCLKQINKVTIISLFSYFIGIFTVTPTTVTSDPTIPDTDIPDPTTPEKDSGFPVVYIVSGVVGGVVVIVVVCVVLYRKKYICFRKARVG